MVLPERPQVAPPDAPGLTPTTSLAQVIAAIAALVGMAIALWHVETSAAAREGASAGARHQLITIDPENLEPVDEGRLIHATGTLQAATPIADTDIGLGFPGAIVVERTVEMFQWREQRAGERHRMAQAWIEGWQDSAGFTPRHRRHVNPKPQLLSQRFVAQDARLGALAVPAPALAGLAADTPVLPGIAPRGWIRHDDRLFLGLDPGKPAIGDLRVSWKILRAPVEVTVLGAQGDTGLAPWRQRNGEDLLRVGLGHQGRDTMLDPHAGTRQQALWAMRLVAVATMTLALAALTLGLRQLASGEPTPPPARRDARLWLQASLRALAFAITLSAMAWIFGRPAESGISMLLAAALAALAQHPERLLRLLERPKVGAPEPTDRVFQDTIWVR